MWPFEALYNYGLGEFAPDIKYGEPGGIERPEIRADEETYTPRLVPAEPSAAENGWLAVVALAGFGVVMYWLFTRR